MERKSRGDRRRGGTIRIGDLPLQERPRERLRGVGERALSLTELLSIALGSGYKGQNSLQLAQTLLVALGGLRGVVKASAAEMQSVHGIGPAKATQIMAAVELGRRLLDSPPEDRARVASPAEVAGLLIPEMSRLQQEELRLVLLDTRNQVLAMPTVYSGSLNLAEMDVGNLLRIAINLNTAAFIVVHNHVSGDPSPLAEDVQATRQLVEAGKLFDIELLDHLIIGGGHYVSLRERGLGFT